MVLVLLSTLIFQHSQAKLPGNPVRLLWDPSPSPEVIGYRLYFGFGSRQYTTSVDVGNTTTTTVSNLLNGIPYYFTVTAYDSSGLESDFSNELVLILPGINSAPVASNGAWPLPMENAVRVRLMALDPDGNPVSYRVVGGPGHGSLLGEPPDLIYLPEPGFTGTDEFSYVATDGLKESLPATIALHVEPTLRLPLLTLGRTQVVHTLGGPPTLLDTESSLSNSVLLPPGGSTVSVTILSNHGPADLLALHPNFSDELPSSEQTIAGRLSEATGLPVLQFSLNSDATWFEVQHLLRNLTFSAGNDEASVQPRIVRLVITDALGLTSTSAQFEVNINRPPEALPDQISTRPENPAVIGRAQLLANDRDDDGDRLSVVNVSPYSGYGGTVVWDSAGVRYSPRAGFSGRDWFVYTVGDGRGGQAVASVEVLVGEPRVLSLRKLQKNNDGTESLSFVCPGTAGQSIHLLSSDDLLVWIPIAEAIAGPDGVAHFEDVRVQSGSNHFFYALEL